jgi:hypothetical protein
MKTLAALTLGLIAIHRPALAQDREPDAVYLTGEADSSRTFAGGAAQAEWVHGVSSQSSIIVGGGSTAIADLHWNYGLVGGFMRRHRVVYAGRIGLGGGRTLEGGFPYARYVGSVAVPIGGSVHGEAEAQYVSVAGNAATVFKVGSVYSGIRRTSLRVSYYSTLSAASHAHLVSGLGEWSAARFSVLGGATTAPGRERTVVVAPTDLSTRPSTEFFGGASVAVGKSRLIGSVQIVPQTSGTLIRVVTTLKLALKHSEEPPRQDAQ